ncbi:hypothetical protein [Paenibacillus sp. 2TAB19]|uniref:hypothetical protein n=1 Tax=Paenibacillus sp. 2TAB19 TaxID=3233003 RepID=UPI003F99E675
MVDEFEFFRKVRAYYCMVPFVVSFKYKMSHKVEKAATALGSFSCRVNPHTQIVEYIMQLNSDMIARPHSEQSSFLFSSVCEEIPPQAVRVDNHLIHSARYPIPIEYDWQKFVMNGAEEAISVQSMNQLFKKWKLLGVHGQQVNADIKVERVEIEWYH